MNTQKSKPNRISVGFVESDYNDLEKLSITKKVSIAWVVRDAVSEYLKRNKVSKNEKK